MYKKKECVASCLPAVRVPVLYADRKNGQARGPVRREYRIIDFPMSNCVNSGI